MSGTVGVICNDNARYSMFSIRLTQLASTPNSQLDWAVTSDRILGRNTLAQRALDRGSEWLMFLDDDHVFSSDILLRLLAHEEAIVGGLYLQRMVPFEPVAYTHKTDDGMYVPLDPSEFGPDEMVRVRGLGTGAMLIRCEVFRAMSDLEDKRESDGLERRPWFEHGKASEDLIFCDKATELGFPIFCDLGARLGHMTQTAIWPSYDDETGWAVGFTVADSFQMKAPWSPREVLAES